ncbi:hypothetical protein OSTOST_07185 [Ostertagia ostertagi]
MEEVMKTSDAPKPDPKPAEKESAPTPATPMLMQAASSRSRELTDGEFEMEMKNLRKLSSSVSPKKFIAMYKDKIASTKCTSCNRKTQGPMEEKCKATMLSENTVKRFDKADIESPRVI